MRLTVLALLAATALVAGCRQPAEAPAAAPTEATAPHPEMPADAPPQEEVDPAAAAPAGEPGSCRSELGEAAAIRLVERCVAVSPASHPPCHPDNPCRMIQGEIDRSCEMYAAGETRPAECGA